MLNILYPTKTVCHFMCEPLQASLYLVGLLWYALRSQLSNLSSMPDSVCMGALPWERAHQDDSNDTPQHICEFLVGFFECGLRLILVYPNP